MDENLKVRINFQDVDTYDQDGIIVMGYNRAEIMEAIKKLLIKEGVMMYGKKHKWIILK